MSVPEWAHFFVTEARHRAFVAAVERDLAAREAEFELGEGSVRLLGAPGSGSESGSAAGSGSTQVGFGLTELGQRWHALGEEAEGPAGEALIRAHFDAVWRRAVEPDPALEARLDELEQARPLLRVRLFKERTAVALAVGLVMRRVARGLFAVLAFDLPEAVRPVEPARFARWGASAGELGDQLWDEALARSLDAPVVVQKLSLFEQVPTLALTGDSFFTTTQLLGLERVLAAQLDGVPELGALVVVPTRHTLLLHPLGVHAVEVNKALHAMQQAGVTLYEQGPGSLSPELYWWRGGAIEHIAAGRDGQGRLVLGAPEAFMREVVGEGA